MKSSALNRTNIWLVILLIIQILCLLMATYGFYSIVRVETDLWSPTPTCPHGAYSMHLFPKVFHQCFKERMQIYVPIWVVLITRIGVVGVALSVLIGVTLWLICTLRRAQPSNWRILYFQLGLLIFFLLWHTFWYPGGVAQIIEFVLHGLILA